MYVVYGTFVKPASLGGCLAVAEDALRAQNLLVVKRADGADYLVIGGNDAVTLTIVCVPQPGNTWVVVSASSGDLGIATQARDVTRGMIEGAPVT
jgi:hypothetical protein